MKCPRCGAEMSPAGSCPACSADTFADQVAAASTAPIPPSASRPRRSGPPLRFDPGQAFGDRYTLVEEIGAGGMGHVYKAIDGRLGKTVALKLVRTDSGPQEQTIERFRRELSLAQEVTHPNVCRVYDLGEIDGTLFISMEYVEGQSLEDLIQSVGTLSAKQTVALGRQICAGLAAIHSRQIVHRDLKPANVMVDRNGHAILMDFGLAYHHGRERLTGEGAVLGTLAYISPEQARGQPTDARTDLYSLGLVLFEMLAGRRAPGDGGAAPLALRESGVRSPPPSRFVPDVPRALDAIVLRCLERDAPDRFLSAAELSSALARLAESLSSGTTSPRARVATRHAPAATLAAAAVVVMSLTGARGWWSAHGPPRTPGLLRPVVAVMPLDTVGGAADDHLGLGIADTLIAHLAGVRGLTVVSRTAAPAADARGQSGRLAHTLGADYVVTGSVQRAEGRMRVVVSLVRPDNSVAWASEYEGAADDVFDLQRRLAEGVSAALAINLTPLDRARLARAATGDVQALDAYSGGQALLERPDVAGNVARAIESFRAAVARDPAFALAHAGLGRAYWQHYLETRDPASAQAATAAVTEALRLDPDQPLTRLALATVYAGTGRGDAAIDELHKVVERLPLNDDAHRQLGDILASRSRWEEAIAELRTAVALRPRFADNLGHLGVVLLASGRYPEAIDTFQRAAALQPDNSRAFQRLGTAYHSMGDEEHALENYRRALALAPDSKAYGNIGVLEYGRGHFVEAAAAFGEAARLDPKSPVAQRNLGDAYTRLGRRAEAAQAYDTAVSLCQDLLKVNPKDAHVLGSLAVYEAKLGRRAGADQHVADALALSPADGDVIYRKAVVSALAGRPEAALAALREALSRGFSATQARSDDDLAGLRNRPGFAAALEAAR